MKPINLLIVDDELIPIHAIIAQLQDMPYRIDYETRGEKALARLKTNPDHYQAILADRMMFGMDGMKLLKAIKEDPQLKEIPFIMQTGEAEPEEVDAAMAAGAVKVIFKPLKKEDLVSLLQEVIT